MKKYRFGFDCFGLIVFVLIMIPNIIWGIFGAPLDVLRRESVTPVVDVIGTVLQVLMIAVLTFIVSTQKPRFSFSLYVILCIVCILLYFACWALYFSGVTAKAVIIGLTIPPCLAFMFIALERRNYLSLIPVAGFTVCHLIFAIVNFIIPQTL